MVARLDNRPLLGTVDRDLFVEPEVMPALKAAIARHLNALILGSRGSGKTTLLRALEADNADDDRPVVYVDLGLAQDAKEALLMIADAMGRPPRVADTFLNIAPATSSSAELLRIARRLGEASASLILIDAPPGEGAAHTLFGRLRDVLWQLPHQWVVAADDVLRDELTRPPASAFFDVQLALDPLSDSQQRDLLGRRLRSEPGVDVGALVGQTDGLPRSLLKLARSAVLSNRGVDEVLAKEYEQQQRLSGLPRSASTVMAYIADNGPTSGSDPRLLASLGVSGQRARQVLRDLEERGLVRSFSEQEERRGRPRKLYALREDDPG